MLLVNFFQLHLNETSNTKQYEITSLDTFFWFKSIQLITLTKVKYKEDVKII